MPAISFARFKEAVQSGTESDLDVVLQFVAENRHNPDAFNQVDDANQTTALMHAAAWGKTAIMTAIFSVPNIDVNFAYGTSNRTALQYALSSPYTTSEAAALLLLSRPEIDTTIPDENKRTPLEQAADAGFNKITKLLLSKTNSLEEVHKAYQAAAYKHNGLIQDILTRKVELTLNLQKLELDKSQASIPASHSNSQVEFKQSNNSPRLFQKALEQQLAAVTEEEFEAEEEIEKRQAQCRIQ